jgi:electron transfer flavoprotein beta subunit
MKKKESEIMQIYVCVKHVPDTAAVIKLTGETGFDDTACKFIINPYDEYAIEEAVQIVEKQGGEVIIVSVGKSAAISTIRSALAMGGHRGILVKTDRQILDSTTTSQALKKAIEQDGNADIIFCGKGAVDTEGYQTPYRLAAAMDIAVVNEIVSLALDGNQALCKREIIGAKETVAVSLPSVLGATKGLNEPRYPKFPDIMKAKKKEVKEIDLHDLGLDLQAGGANLVHLEAVPEQSGAKILEGSLPEQVQELIRILREDEKVIET